MAETFVAVRRGPGGFAQNVCIKRILPAFESDAEFVESFLQEARMSAALRHANIVQVLDFGLADESHYLALELIDGLDLRGLLGSDSDQRRALEPDLVTLIAADVCAALEHAHSDAPGRVSVVHRDVSPSNVLISSVGEVKLTDFGIARAVGGRGRTATGIIKGKVPYMPPEYINHSRFDPRGDLFSLGVMLYEALAAQRPFDGNSDIDTIRRIVAGQHAHLGALAQGAPPHLVQFIERLLATHPDDRYPSARAALEALPPIASHRVRRRLGELVRQRMQELGISHAFDIPEPPPHSPVMTDAAYGTTASARVPDSRIERLPRTHTRDPVLLSEPSTDTRPRNRAPSSRALWTLAGSGALLAVVGALVLSRLPASSGEPDAPPLATQPAPSRAAPSPPGTSPSAPARSDWERNDTVETAPSAPQPLKGASDPQALAPVIADQAAPEPPPQPEFVPPSARDPARARPRPAPRAHPSESSARAPVASSGTAELKIYVQPFGDVWVDGKRLGQAPVTINLEPGSHEVAVGDGRPRERRTIQLAPGQHERLEITRRDLADTTE